MVKDMITWKHVSSKTDNFLSGNFLHDKVNNVVGMQGFSFNPLRWYLQNFMESGFVLNESFA